MFLRIFRYRVKPQMRDRHLALQSRAAQLYAKYVTRTPSYYRRSGDANSWVELHWYVDKAECQKVAQLVADDLELARLWREFQETLDPDQPPTLEEYNEYELPRPVNASPFSQPPIDDATPQLPRPASAKSAVTEKPVTAAIVEAPTEPAVIPPTDPGHVVEPLAKTASDKIASDRISGDNGDGRGHDDAALADSQAGASTSENANGDDPPAREVWPSPPLPAEPERDEIVVEDNPPPEPPSTTLSFNDGVWIVEPQPKRRDDE
ncbi:MAG: hypothetical protein DCC68_10120 [Planctomycetota bacterium]|nr:MAG: hypothetical protein DCC68_10120 [Planctomycetota bacterium]